MRSASSKEGGGSFGCKVGGSLRILSILQSTKNPSHHPATPTSLTDRRSYFEVPASDAEHFGSFSDALRLFGEGGGGGAGRRRRDGRECLDLKTQKSGMIVRHILSAAPEEEEEVLERGWVG